jgi:hypothetical protein
MLPTVAVPYGNGKSPQEQQEVTMEDMQARTQAFNAINSERAYQEMLEKKNGWQEKKKVGEWLVLLNHYVAEANATWCHTSGDEPTLHFIRKIAGIAVACMEENGAPMREQQ